MSIFHPGVSQLQVGENLYKIKGQHRTIVSLLLTPYKDDNARILIMYTLMENNTTCELGNKADIL